MSPFVLSIAGGAVGAIGYKKSPVMAGAAAGAALGYFVGHGGLIPSLLTAAATAFVIDQFVNTVKTGAESAAKKEVRETVARTTSTVDARLAQIRASVEEFVDKYV